MEQLNPRSRKDVFGKKINRDQSPVLVYGIPWLSIIVCSITPMLPIIAPSPIFPPLAYAILLAWRLQRPGVLPLWAGFPLGLIDDLLSGQPMGSGIVLFSLTLIALDLIDLRFPWRRFWQDWLLASLLFAIFILMSAVFSGAEINLLQLTLLAPQLLLTIMLFPVIVSIIAVLDRARLLRVRRIG